MTQRRDLDKNGKDPALAERPCEHPFASRPSLRETTAVEVPSFVADEPLVGNYFVAAYPPFSCWQANQIPAVIDALNGPAPDAPIGLYVHIPFCQKKCAYCYYLSYVGARPAMVDDYVETLLGELRLYSGHPAVKGRPASFVYFGGGTPSLLTPEQTRRLLAGLREVLPWSDAKEVTFECAPRTVSSELLRCLREQGVTRVSMGVQSFDNTLLALNGRVHSAEDAVRAFSLIRPMGFEWVNLDLMTGLMGETAASWENTIQRMIELSPHSATIYQTEIPYNTQSYQRFKGGHAPAPAISWAEKRQRLAFGFEQLERTGYRIASAYSAVKEPSRHEFQYQNYLWRGGDMLGLGVAAFSYFGGVHFQNSVTLGSYMDRIRQGEFPLKRAYRLADKDQAVREFILQLKWGKVSVAAFQKKFGCDITDTFGPQLHKLEAEGLLNVSSSAVQLTRAGLLCVDRLLPYFYQPQHQDLRYT